MFEDYRRQVLETYHRKHAEHTLDERLRRPTRQSLKDYCTVVYRERFRREDTACLRVFFEMEADDRDYPTAMRRLDVDRFRPLHNWLRGETQTPQDRTVELLAWLIDFEPRPYGIYERQPQDRVAERGTTAPGTRVDEGITTGVLVIDDGDRGKDIVPTGGTDKPEEGLTPVPGNLYRKKARVWIPGITALLGIAASLFWLLSKGTDDNCMTWQGDRYEQVNCLRLSPGRLTVALDTQKLRHFRLITQPDTISERSVGHIWYLKDHKLIECFTDSGMHPVHVERKLKPLTKFMWAKYLKHRTDSAERNR